MDMVGESHTSSPQQASHWGVSVVSHNDSCYLPFGSRCCGIAVEGGRQMRENLDGVAFLIPNEDFQNLKEMKMVQESGC